MSKLNNLPPPPDLLKYPSSKSFIFTLISLVDLFPPLESAFPLVVSNFLCFAKVIISVVKKESKNLFLKGYTEKQFY